MYGDIYLPVDIIVVRVHRTVEPWSVLNCAHSQLCLSLYLGDLYEGQYAQGKKHGHGKYTWCVTIDPINTIE